MKNSLTKQTFSVAKIFNEIARNYDRINSILSFGLDKKWRSKSILFLPKEEDLHILDLACGSCEQIITIAKARPNYQFTGVDISENLLKIGREKLLKAHVQFSQLVKTSALDLPFLEETYDAISISFGIRNMENVEKALSEAYRVLKKNGKLLILEFSLPERESLKKPALFYLKYILPKIGNLLSNHSYAYTYLNETIQTFPSGEAFVTLMENAHFVNITMTRMTFGMVTLYVGEKK